MTDFQDKRKSIEDKVKNVLGTPNDEQIIDIGNTVICDVCNKDYTDSNEEGGFLFSGKAYCPKCAEERLPLIKSYGEEKFISEYCPEGVTFKDFILDIRGGDNTIRILGWDK